MEIPIQLPAGEGGLPAPLWWQLVISLGSQPEVVLKHPVARARALLRVADGSTYEATAQLVGRCCGDVVAQWGARFNIEGLAALEPGHGGGAIVIYGTAERERILAEARRTPDREQDGTATWSLMTLRRALRAADDGLPQVSTYTI